MKLPRKPYAWRDYKRIPDATRARMKASALLRHARERGEAESRAFNQHREGQRRPVTVPT